MDHDYEIRYFFLISHIDVIVEISMHKTNDIIQYTNPVLLLEPILLLGTTNNM